MTEKMTSQYAMELEAQYGAHNYHPLPVVLAKGKGAKVFVNLFQKVADSKGRAFGRTPQRAKSLFLHKIRRGGRTIQ